MNKRLTLKDAKQELARWNMTINKQQTGEYRVTFSDRVEGYESRERREAVAYYADDLDDAIGTAKAMHMQHSAVVNRAAIAVKELLGK